MEQVLQVLKFFPEAQRSYIFSRPGISCLEEIRLRRNKKICLYMNGMEHSLPLYAEEKLMQQLIDAVTQRSQYAVMDMLSKGFLILPGGHRIGVCGTGVYRQGEIRTLREISSLNFRIARQIRGVSTIVADFMWNKGGSALCIGIPGCGKTTLLRDLVLQLSDRYCQRIAVVDERQEIAACYRGECQFDLGQRTDVLSGIHKKEGIELVLRSMSPQWIALDEITAFSDVEAILHASYCGVKFLATAHAEGMDDLYARPIYKRLMEEGIFKVIIQLDHSKKPTIQEICA